MKQIIERYKNFEIEVTYISINGNIKRNIIHITTDNISKANYMAEEECKKIAPDFHSLKSTKFIQHFD